MVFKILWPQKRIISEQVIRDWYADALANDEIDSDFIGLDDPIQMALALNDAGTITLATPVPYN